MTSTQDQTAMAKDLCDAVGPVLGSYPGNRVTHTAGLSADLPSPLKPSPAA